MFHLERLCLKKILKISILLNKEVIKHMLLLLLYIGLKHALLWFWSTYYTMAITNLHANFVVTVKNKPPPGRGTVPWRQDLMSRIPARNQPHLPSRLDVLMQGTICATTQVALSFGYISSSPWQSVLGVLIIMPFVSDLTLSNEM